MRIIADLHIHSKYSRATSRDMEVETLSAWAKKKGINLLGTGDITHPTYLFLLKSKLEPVGNGLYKLIKGDSALNFLLSGEVSNIFTQKGRGRRIHTLIFAPDFDVVDRINKGLSKLGNLSADGRPIFGFPVKDLVKLVLDSSPDCLLVPAHAWTPWFSIFGANSGFDSIEECFEEEASNIHAIETGLSSDPQMNWRLSALDKVALISNSDAHSPNKIGREANVFAYPMSYIEIVDAIKKKDKKRFLFTVEFFPEEGKYHFDGHRNCNVLLSPQESRMNNHLCPVCGGRLTVGVMSRVEELADRPPGFVPADAVPARHLVPLGEIIAEALGLGVDTAAVEREYEKLISAGGSEFRILLDLPEEELTRFTPQKILEGIKRVRRGELKITPGYDGVYGKVKIFGDEAISTDRPEQSQMNLF